MTRNQTQSVEERQREERQHAQPNESPDGQAGSEKAPKKRPWLLPVVVVLAVLALFYGIRYYLYAQSHASTDDAYVTSDVIQISPQVGGSVVKVLVKENDHVKSGQVLVQIDPSTYQQAYQQAKDN